VWLWNKASDFLPAGLLEIFVFWRQTFYIAAIGSCEKNGVIIFAILESHNLVTISLYGELIYLCLYFANFPYRYK